MIPNHKQSCLKWNLNFQLMNSLEADNYLRAFLRLNSERCIYCNDKVVVWFDAPLELKCRRCNYKFIFESYGHRPKDPQFSLAFYYKEHFLKVDSIQGDQVIWRVYVRSSEFPYTNHSRRVHEPVAFVQDLQSQINKINSWDQRHKKIRSNAAA